MSVATTDGEVVGDLGGLCAMLQEGVTSKDRSYHLQTFKSCFVGAEAVDHMMKARVVESREDAVALGQLMMDQGLLAHVTADRAFEDGKFFYRFRAMEPDRGHALPDASWAAMAAAGGATWNEGGDAGGGDEDVIEPLDEHNVKLLDLVKPAKWVDPEPAKRYNMVVIGAGTGGLITAVSVAGLGGKVALIEKHAMGGDCLNVGCVPSKALLRCARAVKEVQSAAEFGVHVENVRVDFGKIMERMRRLRASIAPNDSFERYASLGVDMFQGAGKFVSRDTVEVNGKRLRFARCVVASGARARLPPIPGIGSVKVLTNASIFNLTELPDALAVVGGGPIGAEMAQAFARFGSRVTLFDRAPKILPREDPEAAELVQSAMADDGVKFMFGAQLKGLAPAGPGGDRIAVTFVVGEGGAERTEEFAHVLISAGRVPNVEGLGLEAAGVKYSARGVEVDDFLRTSNKNVYAVGDVCLPLQFTHAADFSARMVVRNALFFGSGRFSKLLVPWCTYTSPEVAHVGKYEHELQAAGVEFDVYKQPMEDNDRAILEGDTEGFVKVFCAKGKDEILGATIVAEGAGDLIAELCVAMQNSVGLAGVGATIHSYPTRADAVRRTGDFFSKTRLTPRNKALLRTLLSARR